MRLEDLKYNYPEELIATEPARPSRVMWVDEDGRPTEISVSDLIQKIPAGDVLVLNNTRVLKRRVFVGDLEILFLDEIESNHDRSIYQVMFPSKKVKVGDQIILPNHAVMTLLEKGLPQKVSVTPKLTDADFEKIAELPLPPYIQKARGERHNAVADESWYQTAWAEVAGSFAAPTASLHFSKKDLETLKNKGVQIEYITLHVGLGTFLPVRVENLDDHEMHEEIYQVSPKTWTVILNTRKSGNNVWALGTTVTRTLETIARTEKLTGASKLLLQEGSEFKVVNRLLTNFHQPESTLLALVSGFAGLKNVKHNYSWAIEKRFRLFSYGDLSVWCKRSL